MALSDPVSCLLCLDAYERPTMLRVQLRGINGDGAREHLICQKCGGAIAAEYLYVQQSGKAEASIAAAELGAVQSSDPRPLGETLQSAESMSSPSVAAPAEVGEKETIEATIEVTEKTRRPKK